MLTTTPVSITVFMSDAMYYQTHLLLILFFLPPPRPHPLPLPILSLPSFLLFFLPHLIVLNIK